MRRFFAIFLSIVIILSDSSAFAEADWKFSAYGSTEGIEDLFDGDMFSFDLYMSATDLSAWIIETTWKNGKSTTITLRANIKSKVNDNHLYFVLENGHIIKGHYDQNGYEFWLDFDSGSIRLHSCDEFLTGLDFIGGKYAEVTP